MNLQHLHRCLRFRPMLMEIPLPSSIPTIGFFGKSENVFRWSLSVFTALSCFIYSKSIFFSAPVSPFWIAWNPSLKLWQSFWILFYAISILLISGRKERNQIIGNFLANGIMNVGIMNVSILNPPIFNTFNALIVSLTSDLCNSLSLIDANK